MKAVLSAAVAVMFGLMAQANAQDLENGGKVFRQCLACHKLEPGKHGVGPSLHGVFGGPAGKVEGYRYSANHLKKAEGLVWTDDNLRTYLAKPSAMIPGNKMAFAGLRNPQDIEDVIAYVKANGGLHE